LKKNLSVAELGALVSEKLAKHGIDVVLTGGAVVSIYTVNEYASRDLDFIVSGFAKSVDRAMTELGFVRNGKHFAHPDSPYTIEFPVGPLMIGEMPVRNIDAMKTKLGILKLLPPTECVMDRLAAYYHFKDPQGLDQAIRVAESLPVNFARIKKWSKDEGFLERHADFRARITAAKKKT
jgi:hypothetical protein